MNSKRINKKKSTIPDKAAFREYLRFMKSYPGEQPVYGEIYSLETYKKLGKKVSAIKGRK